MFPRRSEGEELEYPFFKGDGSSSDTWGDYGVVGDNYEGPAVFDDDQYGEESVPFYDTDIEDVIEEEEGFVRKGGTGGEEDNMEDVVVMANDLCSLKIQTCMSTRSSSSSNRIPLFSDLESVIQNRRRNLRDHSLLLDFEEINMSNNLNINLGPPLAGPPHQNHNGPPGPNLHMPAPDLRTMEELCQPTMNGRGGPIAPVNIQATDFGLKNHMIQLVQNSYQFHGLLGDDANKHLNKFLTITQSMKQNGVTDDALPLLLCSLPYSLTHHATAWFDPGGSFMKRRPKERYDLIENMTAHHNDWDTSAQRGESSSSFTSCSKIAALAQQKVEMRKYMLQMFRSNQQVNSVTPSCETCGVQHSYYECQAVGGYTQDVYATTGNYNSGVQPVPSSRPSEIPDSHSSSPFGLPKQNPHQPPIPYPSRLNKEKLQDKSDIQVYKFFQMFKKLHFNISLAKALALIPKYHKMLKDLLSDKQKLLGLANTSLTKNCSAVLLKKLLEKLRDSEKFLIPCDFHELEKCMALADLGANTNLMSLSVWKKLMLPELVSTRKFTFLVDFVDVDYDVDSRVPLILGRPFLRTARALVDIYGEELILIDGDEKLIFHADSTSKHPHKHGNKSINMINFIDITCKDRFPEVLKIKKLNHPFSGSTTSPFDSSPSLIPIETSDSLLKEFADELALLDPFPSGNKEDNFDPEADLREIEYLLNQDSSIVSSPTTDIDIIDPILERFTDEPALVYSSPSGDDDDDLFDLKSDNDEWKKILYGDSFNDTHYENDKAKDSKTNSLIDELETPESNVLLPQLLDCDSTLHEELPEIDTLTSFPSKNKDKVFNPGILVHGSTYFVTNLVTQDKNFKKKTSSKAPLILKERNFMSIPSNRELPFHYELPRAKNLLSFSSKNEDKVFNPGILISKGVPSFTMGLFHRTYETFKIVNFHPNILNEGPMKIFPFFCFCPKDKRIQGESS
ncbi:hypothetical protein Tco_0988042 [Tanacetum coccineum]|uniref:Reverse transcriptase domain-containing protein n=1 Tax=Tanacetum coccineum TaxID=301880 RepID=A0ABQ5EQB0_9ASTR